MPLPEELKPLLGGEREKRTERAAYDKGVTTVSVLLPPASSK
jgi:hypothetical protein